MITSRFRKVQLAELDSQLLYMCLCFYNSTCLSFGQDAQFYLQDIVLSGHKWLLRGQLDCLRQTSIQTFLDEAGKRAVNKIHQEHDYLICYAEIRVQYDLIDCSLFECISFYLMKTGTSFLFMKNYSGTLIKNKTIKIKF